MFAKLAIKHCIYSFYASQVEIDKKENKNVFATVHQINL